MRHGQALSNVRGIISCYPEKFHNPLSDEGRIGVEESAKTLEGKHIDIIISSDILRTKETAQITANIIGVKEVLFNEHLREYNVGVFNGMPITDFSTEYPDVEARFHQKPKTGESYAEITERMYTFLQECEKQYTGKTILVVSHQVPLALLIYKVSHLSKKEVFKEYFLKGKMKNAEVVKLN